MTNVGGVMHVFGWKKKKIIDWRERENELVKLLRKHKSKSGNFDCIVPVSGGKDGTYVTDQLINKYN